MNLKESKFKIYLYVLIFFGLLGLGAMVYLIFSFNIGLIPQNSCDIFSSAINCGKVVTSTYSTFLGMDLYYYGIGFFAVILALVFMTFFNKKTKTRKNMITAVNIISLLGVFAAAYLIYLELFKIHYICLLCTTGHIAIVALFVTSMLFRRAYIKA